MSDTQPGDRNIGWHPSPDVLLDDIRTRIARVLAGITPNNTPKPEYFELADAVIAELWAILKPRLDEYEEARRYDAEIGEADNCGNVEGDKLAKFITDWLGENDVTDWNTDWEADQ